MGSAFQAFQHTANKFRVQMNKGSTETQLKTSETDKVQNSVSVETRYKRNSFAWFGIRNQSTEEKREMCQINQVKKETRNLGVKARFATAY